MMRNKIILTLLLFISFNCSFAQSQGPLSPTMAVNGPTGPASLVNVAGFYAADNNPAYVDLAAYPTCSGVFQCYYSQYVTISGFGFSIPSTATITGIRVEISKKVSQPVTTIHDSIVRLVKSTGPVGNSIVSTVQWPMTFTYQTHGDSTNLWGTTWTPAEINSPSFGVYYRITNGNIDQTAQMDHVRITVYYNTASGITESANLLFNYVIQNKQFNVTSNLKDNAVFRVFDVQGREVINEQIRTGMPVNLAGLKPELYIFNVFTPKESYNGRFLLLD
jgi:hypothetical protein